MKRWMFCAALLVVSVSGCSEPECRVGERICENNVSKTCQNGAWLEVVCENSAPVCDDRLGCIAVPQFCGNGLAEGNEACDGTALRDKTCGDMFDGLVGTLACTGECEFDTSGCHVPGCENGQVLCAGSKLQTCRDGVWEEQDCGALVCDPAEKKCAPRLCEEETRRCTGQILEICVANRWHTVTDCAENGLKCDPKAAACVQNNCTEGEKKCGAENGISSVMECVRNQWTASPCDTGMACTKNIETGAFSCAPQTCNEGVSCDGDRLVTCKYNLIISSRNCSNDGMKCENGACM